MAQLPLRRIENADGNYFVDSSCIDCDACRQIAPSVFAERGGMSAVIRQPASRDEEMRAGKALVSCPTASIGTVEPVDLTTAIDDLPERIDDDVYRCGFTSEKSFGAFSYLIARSDGGVLVDSPRFSRPLLRNVQSLGGARTMLLTHSDDVADHERWHRELGCERVLHARDVSTATRGVERQPEGNAVAEIGPDLLMIPTPGHTAGHAVYLYRSKFLFSGDHLAWSPRRPGLIAFRGVCWYDWETQTHSMERLLDFTFEWVLPGHGRPVRLEPDSMRDSLLRLVDWMRTV